MPKIDLLKAIIDILAKRYGWSYTSIAEDMYWEDVYEMYEYACNLDAVERNDSMKFDFMLHAQSEKALRQWSDFPIPFPDHRYKPMENKIPKSLPRPFARSRKAGKATPEEAERLKVVRQRMDDQKRKVSEAQRQQMYGF